MSHYSSGKLFATEKIVKDDKREYCEVDYAGKKGNKQISLKSTTADTLFEESIQYKLEGEKEVPDYKLLSIKTENDYLNQKIDLTTNEIIQEDKTENQLDKKGNWIEKSIYKNDEFRYKIVRKITYY